MPSGPAQDSSERWGDANTVLEVKQPKQGFACTIDLRADIDASPKDTFDVLTTPDNTHIFRNIKRITSRKVVEDDKRGRQKVQVEHEAEWRFLCFGGTFTTSLEVEQNEREGTIEFKLIKSGLMRDFYGKWKIQPLQAPGMAKPPPVQRPSWLRLPFMPEEPAMDRLGKTRLLLTQSIAPNVTPPPPVDRIMKGIASRQARNLVEDLRAEIARRRAAQERSQAK